ncbi:hypothetical protein EDB85DRAFT_2271449 [Lactarius pseudohatsudake]|nr:hypothetical protein EDB85DRAFT_2271449 [Lactarius pseudohatsudake]
MASPNSNGNQDDDDDEAITMATKTGMTGAVKAIAMVGDSDWGDGRDGGADGSGEDIDRNSSGNCNGVLSSDLLGIFAKLQADLTFEVFKPVWIGVDSTQQMALVKSDGLLSPVLKSAVSCEALQVGGAGHCYNSSTITMSESFPNTALKSTALFTDSATSCGAQEGGDPNEPCSVNVIYGPLGRTTPRREISHQNAVGSLNLHAMAEGVAAWTNCIEESAPTLFASYGLKGHNRFRAHVHL